MTVMLGWALLALHCLNLPHLCIMEIINHKVADFGNEQGMVLRLVVFWLSYKGVKVFTHIISCTHHRVATDEVAISHCFNKRVPHVFLKKLKLRFCSQNVDHEYYIEVLFKINICTKNGITLKFVKLASC